MRNTIKPFGKSLGIIALLVVALVFGFAVLVSCETGADGKDGKPAQQVYIDEDGFWVVDGQRYKDPFDKDRYVRAYMREPEAKDFDLGTPFKSQLNQTYGNVKEVTLNYLPGMSQGDLSFNYKLVNEDGTEGSFIFPVNEYSGVYTVGYYTSGGLNWFDDDGRLGAQRTNGVFTPANKIVKLDPGTYRIYFNISRDNKYFYSANNVPIPGDDVLLTVSAAEVKASDFAFIDTCFYTGAVVESEKIVQPNRNVLEDIVVEVYYYPVPVGQAELAPWGAEALDVAKGPYTVKVGFEIPEGARNKWYLLDADGNKIYSTPTNSRLTVGTLTVLPRYPEDDQYTYSNNSQVAYQLRLGAAQTLETPDIVIVPVGGKSSGARTIVSYQRDATAGDPAYGPSRTVPVMPGAYSVTFHVGLPSGYPDDKNWLEADVTTTFTLTIPELGSISALSDFLTSRPASGTDNLFYSVKIKVIEGSAGIGVNALDDDALTSGSLGYLLKGNSGRKVKLDLSDGSNNVESVGSKAFFEVDSLFGIKLPGSVKEIGDYAFEYCTGLVEVDLGGIAGSLTEIGVSAFTGTKIKSIVFPSGLTDIGANAFSGCDLLESITIPDNVTIENGALSSQGFLTAYQGTGGGAGTYTKSTTGVWTKGAGNPYE